MSRKTKKSVNVDTLEVQAENVFERENQLTVEVVSEEPPVDTEASAVHQEDTIEHDNSGITEESSMNADTVSKPVENPDVIQTVEPVTDNNDINIKERRTSGSGSVYRASYFMAK